MTRVATTRVAIPGFAAAGNRGTIHKHGIDEEGVVSASGTSERANGARSAVLIETKKTSEPPEEPCETR
jgi:hypothetical protein